MQPTARAALLYALTACASPPLATVSVEPVPPPSASVATVVSMPLTPEERFAQMTPGEMPSGEKWSGVYFHPVYGYLHLIESSGIVHGKWQRTDKSHWGELEGTATRNLLRFKWKEHAYGLVGPAESTTGSGVFVYGANGDIHGRYAVTDSTEIGEWPCVKQRGATPDFSALTLE